MNKLKPGAHMFAEELQRAVVEAELWVKRRDNLIFQCIALGWKHREIADMVGCSSNAIAVKVSRARRAREAV